MEFDNTIAKIIDTEVALQGGIENHQDNILYCEVQNKGH